ncbi:MULTISPECIES: hypothetical protein [unclassified Schlesneria]|uniref:hypothetical protein n=1 Tax=Schlesneria TaxID=656899 RepID=UPI002F1F9110
MSVATLEAKAAPASPRTLNPASQFERYDTIDTPTIVVVGFISAILTFVTILATQAIFFATNSFESKRKITGAVPAVLADSLTQQQNRLAGYGWVDPAKGVVSIPISEAMRLVVQEQQQSTKAVTE